MTAAVVRPAPWTAWHAIAAVAMALAGIYVTREAWADIYYIGFEDEESSHIFLVPFVAAWMAFARQLRLRYIEPTGTIIGPLIIAAGWIAWSYGYNHAMQVAWHAGAVAIVVGCVLSVLGKSVLFRFFPAFAVLVFLVPVPAVVRQSISIPLQTSTAALTQAIFETFGVEVLRFGNRLQINGVDVAVAEACNGLRMVFALVLVSYAFAFSTPLRNSVRAIILLASPVAAILCNVVRLVPTIWLYGDLGAGSAAAKAFHDWGGWIMLPTAFVLLLGIMRALRWALIPVARYNLAYQ